MSGVLESIVERLTAIEARLANGAAQPAQPAYVPPVVQPAAQPAYVPPVAQQPQFDPMTGQPLAQQPVAQPAAPATVSEAQVMALIEPHLENVPLKTALQGVLAQMGIAKLPDARPDQYAALYAAFSGVIQQFAGAAPVAAAPQGII